MKILTLTFAAFILLTLHSLAYAGTVYNLEGKSFAKFNSLDVYPQTFNSKEEADSIALTLENGQVFQDVDSKKYQVLYGSVVITGVVQLASVTE